MTRSYLYLCRPPAYAHQPDGWVDREGGLPMRDYLSPGGPCSAFGVVTYPEPLLFDKTWQFDLLPRDPQEWAHYRFWLLADRDVDWQKDLEDDYIQAYRKNQLDESHAYYLMAKILGDI